jgi:hypothetical protein
VRAAGQGSAARTAGWVVIIDHGRADYGGVAVDAILANYHQLVASRVVTRSGHLGLARPDPMFVLPPHFRDRDIAAGEPGQ